MNAPIPIQYVPEAPQPLVREIPEGMAYPVDALGALAPIVKAVQDRTQAPVAIAAQSALACASLAVQGFADVETLVGQSPCSLYCLTIAASGERKSACDKFVMGAVREFEADRVDDYRIALARHDKEQKLWNKKQERLLKEAAGKGPKAAEALADLDAMNPSPVPPVLPFLIATEPTFPGLVKLFGKGRPALGLFTDEGGAFVGGHAMNSDNKLATVAGLSGFWDGTPINRTRVEDGVSTLCGRRLASHLMIQPIAARPMLADPVISQQGFLARFLIVEPVSAIGTRLQRGHSPGSDVAISAFKAKLRTVLEAELPLRDGHRNELQPGLLSLTADAREILTQYYENTEKEQATGGSLAHVRAYASKSAEQAARIAGVLALWENQNAQSIDAKTMVDGVKLAQFYLSEASRLADGAMVSLEIERAEMLRKWLLEAWGETNVLLREIMRKGPNALRESPVAKAAIKLLVEHGWLVALPEGTHVRGSARKEAYAIAGGRHVV